MRFLTREKRYEIARLHDVGVSTRRIAARLQRSPAAVSRELRRNQHPQLRLYLPEAAHAMPLQRQRRPKMSKLTSNPALRQVVQQMLDKHSPDQIAGRLTALHRDDKTMQVSHETTY